MPISCGHNGPIFWIASRRDSGFAPRGLFDVTASNYGLLPPELETLSQSCLVVASFGAKDRIARRGSAAKLEAELARGEVPRDTKEYPTVGHSFMNDWRLPGPNPHHRTRCRAGPLRAGS
jgi:dienelactone hydrolase